METYVIGIGLLTFIGILFIGIFGMLFLNTKTIYEYDFHVLYKTESGFDLNFVEVCKQRGLDGWQLIEMDESDVRKITLIFMKTYTKSKLF